MQLNTLYYQAPTNLGATQEKIHRSLMINGGYCYNISPELMRYTKGGFIADLIFEEKDDGTGIIIKCSTTTGRVIWGVIFLFLFFPITGILVGLYVLAYRNFQTSLNMAGAQETVFMMYNTNQNLRQN